MGGGEEGEGVAKERCEGEEEEEGWVDGEGKGEERWEVGRREKDREGWRRVDRRRRRRVGGRERRDMAAISLLRDGARRVVWGVGGGGR